MEEDMEVAIDPVEAGLKRVKKRIELVRSSSIESVRVSARQAERKAIKASRDNSEERKDEEPNGKSRKVVEEDQSDRLDRIMGEMKVNTNKKVDDIEEYVSTPTYERQESSDLLDELVMDFGDEELDEELEDDLTYEDVYNEPANEEKLVDDIAGEVAGELMEEKEAEDSEPYSEDEEAEPPAEEPDEDYDEIPTKPRRKPSARAPAGKEKLWKYGKLWEFIRDLLKIPRYNPSVIRWELEDEGEFRIVDSSMVARLWATVKGNKKMNYEKLSRAMRYYYKHKVFEIVPNKRLVYKFGSRAYSWRKQELEKPGAERVPCPAQGRRRTTWRCGECLRMFQSGREHEVHSSACSDTLALPEDQSKKDAEKLRSHLAARSQVLPRATRPPREARSLHIRLQEALEKETQGTGVAPVTGNKPLRQKLTELKSKLPPEPSVVTSGQAEPATQEEGQATIQLTITPQEEGSEPIHLVIHSPPVSSHSDIQSMSTKEHDALESLMCLGEDRQSDEATEPPATVVQTSSPVQLPLMVSELNKASTPSPLATSPSASDPVARNYIVIPNLAALAGVAEPLPTLPSPPAPAAKPRVADKINFLKSANEKSKTHTILQRRVDNMPPKLKPLPPAPGSATCSDDEVEVVKIVKTPKAKENDMGLPVQENAAMCERATAELRKKMAGTEEMKRKNETMEKILGVDTDLYKKIQQSSLSLKEVIGKSLGLNSHKNKEVRGIPDQTIPPPPKFSDNEGEPMIVDVDPKYATTHEKEYAGMGEVEMDAGQNKLLNEMLDKNMTDMRKKDTVTTELKRNIAHTEKGLGVNGTNNEETNHQTDAQIQMQQKFLGHTSVGTLRRTSEKYIDFLPNQSPVVDETQEPPRSSLIRINPKYKGMLMNSTENIAAKDDAIPTVVKSAASSSPSGSPRPMIKINPKYQPGQVKTMLSINPKFQVQSSLKSQLSEEEERAKEVVIENAMGELLRIKKSNGDLLKKCEQMDKISDLQDKSSQLAGPTHRFKRVAESLMPSKQQAKRPRLSENLENLRQRAASTNQLVTTSAIIPRRYTDRIDRITGPVPSMPTFMTKEKNTCETPEPLLDLWKFLRALLHNPAFNPKMVNWEILEEGMFRIHNLSDFYNLWRDLKKTDISYDLLTKTLKMYDERKILHGVYNHRCVYKFGESATEWRPNAEEIIYIGKKPVPNQAAWPNSRFYGELDPKAPLKTTLIAAANLPTTLFTLRPLDTSSTQLSEMQVMSDNSSLLQFGQHQFAGKLPPAAPKPLTLKSCTDAMAEIKIESLNDNIKFENEEEKEQSVPTQEVVKPLPEDIEVDCKLILPWKTDGPAILNLPGGVTVKLDRSIFKEAEENMAIKNIMTEKNIRTTIVPRDRSQSLKTGRFKVLTRKKNQPRSFIENPLTVAQMMETMIPKKLNFILPKLNRVGGGLPGGSETAGSSAAAEMALPVPVLDKAQEECGVSLHLPETLPAQTSPSSSGHRLPGQVALPSPTLPYTVASSGAGYTITLPPSFPAASTPALPSPASDFLPSTVEHTIEDLEADDMLSDDDSLSGVNKNVLRCRNYRDRRKNMLQEQEHEVHSLEMVNSVLRRRHDHLDSGIKKLQEYYLAVIRDNKYKCCGANGR